MAAAERRHPNKSHKSPTLRVGEVQLCLDLKNQIRTALEQRWTPLVAAGSREELELGEPSGPKGLGLGFESAEQTGREQSGHGAGLAQPQRPQSLP